MTSDAEMEHLIVDDLPEREAYHLLNATVAPRLIAWISTVSRAGVFNAAPYSYTTALSAEPPIVCFSSKGDKDSSRNARETGAFVYNVGGLATAERMNRTAADFPADQSEFDWAGLTPLPSLKVPAPRIAEAPIQMECLLEDIYEVRDSDNLVVIGRVVAFHVHKRMYAGGRVDTARMDPLLRISGSDYAAMGNVFRMTRPTYRGLLAAGEPALRPERDEPAI